MADERINFPTDGGYRVELNVWRNDTPLHYLLLDARCLAIDTAPGLMPFPRLRHIPSCDCGDRSRALTRPQPQHPTPQEG